MPSRTGPDGKDRMLCGIPMFSTNTAWYKINRNFDETNVVESFTASLLNRTADSGDAS